MMTDREYRHQYYVKRTAAWEAVRWCKKFYPWRIEAVRRIIEDEAIWRAQQ